MSNILKALTVKATDDEIFSFTTEIAYKIVKPRVPCTYVAPLFTSFCVTDIFGYYKSRRFAHDYLFRPGKFSRNIKYLNKLGIEASEPDYRDLLAIPNHEAVCVVTQCMHFTEVFSMTMQFVPKRDNEVQLRLEQAPLDMDFSAGDLVVLDSSLRCEKHMNASGNRIFPMSCHRSTIGHNPKMVPGHFELPGATFQTQGTGLPYPAVMLSKIPRRLADYLSLDRKHLASASSIEVIGCVFESLSSILINVIEGRRKAPKQFFLLGDGFSAAAIAFIVSQVFPRAVITVLGATKAKLAAIQNIEPQRISVIESERTEPLSSFFHSCVINSGDVVVSTFKLRTNDNCFKLLPKDANVVFWTKPTGGIRNLHCEASISYGGLFKGEKMAIRFLEFVLVENPQALRALLEFPRLVFELSDSAKVFNNWLDTLGKVRDVCGVSHKITVSNLG
jgi:hypothetical protein